MVLPVHISVATKLAGMRAVGFQVHLQVLRREQLSIFEELDALTLVQGLPWTVVVAIFFDILYFQGSAPIYVITLVLI